MADALDVELGALVSVTEGNVFVRQPVMETARVMALQGEAPTSVSPGEVSVSASVSIEYRIEVSDVEGTVKSTFLCSPPSTLSSKNWFAELQARVPTGR